MPPTATLAWIFQAVPSTYDLLGALRDKTEDVWVAKQRWRDMEPGQRIYFWCGAPVGGIVATGEITGAISEEAPPPAQAAYWRANAGRRRSDPIRRVPVVYMEKFPLSPIRRASLAAFPELARQSPIGGFFAATNFAVRPEADRVLRAILAARTK